MTCLTITRRLGTILVVTGNFACGNFAYANFACGNFACGNFACGNFACENFACGNFSYCNFACGNFAHGDFAYGNFSCGNKWSYCSRPVQPMNSPIHRIPDDFFYCGRSAEVLQLVHVTSPAVGDGLCLS